MTGCRTDHSNVCRRSRCKAPFNTRTTVADQGPLDHPPAKRTILDCSNDPVRNGGWSKLSSLPEHVGESVLPEPADHATADL